MHPPGQPTTGSWMRRNPLRLGLRKAGVMLVSREKELEEWAKTVADASTERECHSPAKFTASAGCTASNKISPCRRMQLFIIFMQFFPWLFDLTNPPQLGYLWHHSRLQLCPTCVAFYLVRLIQSCTCIMEEHPGIWCVRTGHCMDSFCSDCWPWRTIPVFLTTHTHRQPSSSLLSPRAQFSFFTISAYFWDYTSSMIYHLLALPMGVTTLDHCGIHFSPFFLHQLSTAAPWYGDMV